MGRAKERTRCLIFLLTLPKVLCLNAKPSYVPLRELLIGIFFLLFSDTFETPGYQAVGPCKVIQESLGFWIPRCGFRIPCPWIPDSTFEDFGFHGPKVAGFQILVSNVSFELCFPNEMTLRTFAPKIFPRSDIFQTFAVVR